MSSIPDPDSSPDEKPGRLLAIALLAAVWIVFLGLGLGTSFLTPPIAALALVFLLYPIRAQAWASRVMLIVAGLALFWLLAKVQSIVWIAALGLFLAYLLNPAVTALVDRGVPRGRAATLLFLPAILLIVLALNFLIPALYNEATTFINNLPDFSANFTAWYHQKVASLHPETWPIDLNAITERVKSSADRFVANIGAHLLKFTKGLGVVLATAILTPVVAFNLLKDFPSIKRNLMMLVPARYESEVLDLLKEMDVLIGRWLRGQLIVAAIVGTATAIGLSLMGIPYAILLGAETGALNFIPVIGYWISLIATIFVTITSGHDLGSVVAVLALYFGLQLLEQNFLSPRIIGQATNLHPVAILLALLVFGTLLGFAGALLAIPIVLFLRVFYRRYLRSVWRGEELPPGLSVTVPAPPRFKWGWRR